MYYTVTNIFFFFDNQKKKTVWILIGIFPPKF